MIVTDIFQFAALMSAPAGASHDGEPRRGDAQPGREEAQQLGVGRTVDRWRGDADFHRVPVPARHRGRARAREDVERDRAHRQMTDMRNCRSSHKTSQATSGLQSNMPMGGRTRLIGPTSQSVSAYAGRIHLE